MKKYKFIDGFKAGSVCKIVPGVGLMKIDEHITDAQAEALIEVGVTGIFELVKQTAKAEEPKTNTTDGKKTTESTNSASKQTPANGKAFAGKPSNGTPASGSTELGTTTA